MTSGKVRRHRKPPQSHSSTATGQATSARAVEAVAKACDASDEEPVPTPAPQVASRSSADAAPAGKPAGTRKSPRCPRCGGPLVRKHRNLLDRLRSLTGTLHRYRCGAFGCGWEGVLPASAPESQHRRYRGY